MSKQGEDVEEELKGYLWSTDNTYVHKHLN